MNERGPHEDPAPRQEKRKTGALGERLQQLQDRFAKLLVRARDLRQESPGVQPADSQEAERLAELEAQVAQASADARARRKEWLENRSRHTLAAIHELEGAYASSNDRGTEQNVSEFFRSDLSPAVVEIVARSLGAGMSSDGMGVQLKLRSAEGEAQVVYTFNGYRVTREARHSESELRGYEAVRNAQAEESRSFALAERTMGEIPGFLEQCRSLFAGVEEPAPGYQSSNTVAGQYAGTFQIMRDHYNGKYGPDVLATIQANATMQFKQVLVELAASYLEKSGNTPVVDSRMRDAIGDYVDHHMRSLRLVPKVQENASLGGSEEELDSSELPEA